MRVSQGNDTKAVSHTIQALYETLQKHQQDKLYEEANLNAALKNQKFVLEMIEDLHDAKSALAKTDCLQAFIVLDGAIFPDPPPGPSGAPPVALPPGVGVPAPCLPPACPCPHREAQGDEGQIQKNVPGQLPVDVVGGLRCLTARDPTGMPMPMSVSLSIPMRGCIPKGHLTAGH